LVHGGRGGQAGLASSLLRWAWKLLQVQGSCPRRSQVFASTTTSTRAINHMKDDFVEMTAGLDTHT
jgi:hypothetical protein